MPKFLDAPSWYDDDGNLKTIEGSFTIVVEGGWGSTIEVPYVGGANKQYLPYVSGHRALVAQGSAFGQIPYWQNGSAGFQNIAAGTTKGQVLTWNGSRTTPSWTSLEPFPKLYAHTGNISQLTASWSLRGYICYTYYSTDKKEATTPSELSNALYALLGQADLAASGWIRIGTNNVTYPTYAITGSSSGALKIHYTDGANSLQDLTESIASSGGHFIVTEDVVELF